MTEILLSFHNESGRPAPTAQKLAAAARAALDTGPTSGTTLERAEISITMVTAERMRELNRDYHDSDEPTDVLAFGLDPVPSLLADAYICPEVAEASASAHDVSSEQEILRLVIHAILHLLGHDHPDGEERYGSEMFELQERVLEGLAPES